MPLNIVKFFFGVFCAQVCKQRIGYNFLTIQKPLLPYTIYKYNVYFFIIWGKKKMSMSCVLIIVSLLHLILFSVGAEYWWKVKVNNELERKTVQSLTLLYWMSII